MLFSVANCFRSSGLLRLNVVPVLVPELLASFLASLLVIDIYLLGIVLAVQTVDNESDYFLVAFEIAAFPAVEGESVVGTGSGSYLDPGSADYRMYELAVHPDIHSPWYSPPNFDFCWGYNPYPCHFLSGSYLACLGFLLYYNY